jgi:hypothetical protein
MQHTDGLASPILPLRDLSAGSAATYMTDESDMTDESEFVLIAALLLKLIAADVS